MLFLGLVVIFSIDLWIEGCVSSRGNSRRLITASKRTGRDKRVTKTQVSPQPIHSTQNIISHIQSDTVMLKETYKYLTPGNESTCPSSKENKNTRPYKLSHMLALLNATHNSIQVISHVDLLPGVRYLYVSLRITVSDWIYRPAQETTLTIHQSQQVKEPAGTRE